MQLAIDYNDRHTSKQLIIMIDTQVYNWIQRSTHE